MTTPNIDRFWNKILIIPFHDCWEWLAGKDKNGYGKITFNAKETRAHRLSYEIHYGVIPNGFFVCHKCDNPSCVNPKHLFLGSPLDNMQDMILKGRKITSPKLSKTSVKEIRHKYAQGNISQIKLAKEYGVSQQVISAIILYKIWHQ